MKRLSEHVCEGIPREDQFTLKEDPVQMWGYRPVGWEQITPAPPGHCEANCSTPYPCRDRSQTLKQLFKINSSILKLFFLVFFILDNTAVIFTFLILQMNKQKRKAISNLYKVHRKTSVCVNTILIEIQTPAEGNNGSLSYSPHQSIHTPHLAHRHISQAGCFSYIVTFHTDLFVFYLCHLSPVCVCAPYTCVVPGEALDPLELGLHTDYCEPSVITGNWTCDLYKAIPTVPYHRFSILFCHIFYSHESSLLEFLCSLTTK